MMFVIVVLWTGFFLVNFNIAMMIPLLPFIQQALGLTTHQAGIVLAAFPVVALASNLVLGPWIDRYGRRRFLIAGAAGCAAIFLLTAATDSLATLTLCRIAVGLFMPMLGASVFAAIGDYVPAEGRARVSGYVTTAAPVAFLLFMSLGVLLAGYVAWQLPLVLIAVVAAAMAAGAARLPAIPATALAHGPITLLTYRRRLLSLSMGTSTRLLLLAHFSWAAAMFVFLGLYPTWVIQYALADRGPGTVSAMLFVGEIGGLVGALYSGRMAKLSPRPFGLCALAGLATAAVVLTVPLGTGSVAFQTVAYAAYAFGRDVMLALIMGGAMALVQPAERGTLNALLNAIYQTGATLGLFASAVLYGMYADFTANAAMSAAAFIMAAASLWRITAR